MSEDDFWLQKALTEAKSAYIKKEVPIGAVLINSAGELLASGHNETIMREDPTAHAEIVVLRAAAKKIKNHRLVGTTLYITVEPCVMCWGALVHARVKRVVYGVNEPRSGALDGCFGLSKRSGFNHYPEVTGPVGLEEASAIMQDFFSKRR